MTVSGQSANGPTALTLQWPLEPPPPGLYLPQFVDSEPANVPPVESRSHDDESHSQPFIFSALFQSSPASSLGLSALHTTPSHQLSRSLRQSNSPSYFIGFSWGPVLDAFPDPISENRERGQDSAQVILSTPQPIRTLSSHVTPNLPMFSGTSPAPQPFATPVRTNAWTPHHTLPRTSASRRTVPRRPVSDREAMKQLVDCVGMSARKKVLESGRKPRILTSFNRSGTVKELRFDLAVDKAKSDRDSSLHGLIPALSGSEDTDTEGPPSPSPSPRPGSGMSMRSRQSGTPTTTTGSYSQRIGLGAASISTTPVQDPRPNSPSEAEAWRDNGGRLFELEEKHALLMRDILDIEQRLQSLDVGG
jgi:hypothetical protein